jgi:hypothetical protein
MTIYARYDPSAGESPELTLFYMATGHWVTRSLYAAARLGIADLLRDGPRSSDALAQATETDPAALYRLLRALASLGIFAEDTASQFSLTPLANSLRSDVPGSMRAFVLAMGGEWEWQAWDQLLYSIKTGQPALDHVTGTTMFQYFAQHPEEGKDFTEAMIGVSELFNAAVLEAYDFSSIGTLVDVGGGTGSLLTSILRAYPSLRGVLFDQAHIIEHAQALLASDLAEIALGASKAGPSVASRCQCVAGNFFQAIPAGGDAYLIQRCLHNWDDEHALQILRNIRQAMPENGKLLVSEMVLPAGNEPFFGKFLDVDMLLVSHGGRERSTAHFEELFAASGFTLTRVIPTRSPLSIVEGAPMS